MYATMYYPKLLQQKNCFYYLKSNEFIEHFERKFQQI